MNTLVAIDPGINRSGVAVFGRAEDGAWYLVRAFAVTVTPFVKKLPADQKAGSMIRRIVGEIKAFSADEIVCEYPQVYRGARSVGDPNDLLWLAYVAGGVATSLAYDVTLVRPAEWKRQVPKTVMNARVRAALRRSESGAVEDDKHDVWDAIGIGLVKVGRMRPGGGK